MLHEEIQARSGQGHIGNGQGHIQPDFWDLAQIPRINQGLDGPIKAGCASVHAAAQGINAALPQQAGKEMVNIGNVVLAESLYVHKIIHGHSHHPLAH